MSERGAASSDSAFEVDTRELPLTAPLGTPAPLEEAYESLAEALLQAAEMLREPPRSVHLFETQAHLLSAAFHAALTRYAFRNPRFDQLVKTKRIQVRWSAPTNSKIYLNNNYLLHEYTGANGVKTGYTHEAGWCLVASATRHGKRLIAVVLDSPNMYADAKRLLNLGFSHA